MEVLRFSADASRIGCRAGLLLTVVMAMVLAVGFDLRRDCLDRERDRPLGSHLGHRRAFSPCPRGESRWTWVLVLGITSTIVVLTTFALTTLVDAPATTVTLVAILALSVVVDELRKRRCGDHRSRGVPHTSTLVAIITVTVALSVFAHGISAAPLARRYASWHRVTASPMESAPGHQQRWRHGFRRRTI